MDVTTATTTRETAFLHQNGLVKDHKLYQAKDVQKVHSAREDKDWPQSPEYVAPLATSESFGMDEVDFVPSSQATVHNKSSKAILSPVPNMSAKAGLCYADDGVTIVSTSQTQ